MIFSLLLHLIADYAANIQPKKPQGSESLQQINSNPEWVATESPDTSP